MTSSGGSLLDPAALLDLVPRLLPSSSDGAASSGSQLRNPSDAIVALLHAILTRLSFRLVAVGEGSGAINVPASSSSESSATPPNVLPPSWNASGPSSYSLTYTHDQSSLRFLLKTVPLGPRTLVHGTALEHDRTATFEFETDRYTSKAFWPYPAATGEASGGAASSHPEPLVNGYISSSRIKDLVLGFQAHVVQKLVPGLRKEGYEEVSSTAESGSSAEASSSSRQDQQQGGDAGQRLPPPGGIPSRPPYFEDPDDPSRPFGIPPAFPQPGRSPFAIGDRDLDPLGGRSPLRLPGQGGGGFGPPPLFPGGPGSDNGGGMFVGPDHPMFRDRFPQQGGGAGGPFGGDGVLPPGAVPPGARFDPIGPFNPPAGGGGAGGPMRGGVPRPRGGGPRPPGFGSGDPDWDDVRPPRGGSDYDNMFG